MKKLATILCVLLATSSFTQRDLTPSNKRQAFGKRDFRDLSNTGWQVQFGPAYTFTRLENESQDFTHTTSRGDFNVDPAGRIGVFGEIGLMHFPKKRSKLSLALKTVLVSYYDYGIGFKYFGGKETTNINYRDVVGNLISTDDQTGAFYNGYIYARFSIHKNIHFERAKNFFLDNTLGVNADYRLITDDQESDYHNFSTQFSQESYYHKPLVAQLHYGLGFGFRLKRGMYLIPGFRTPILGFHEWNKGNPSLRWFSSKYWPVMFQLKLMNLFPKRNKGKCPAVDVNEEDRKRNDQFMQGN